MPGNDNWANASKLTKMLAALIFLLLITWPISAKHSGSGMTGQLSSPRFSDLISALFYVLLLPGHSFSKMKTKYQLIPLYYLQKKLQSTYIFQSDSRQKKKKNCLKDIKSLLGLSGLDSVNSTLIHILSKTKLSKTICTHIHQMPPRKMKNSQSEPLTWLANRKGLMNLDMASAVYGRMPEETYFTEEANP